MGIYERCSFSFYLIIKKAYTIKTAGSTGGLHYPYKGLILALPLKGF